MKIFVCVKQVPDTETKIKLTASAEAIDTTGIKWVMNPYDEYAVEEALKYREKLPGSQVWVISLGPKTRVVETLRTALAMGADEAIVVDAAEPTDVLVTAKALAQVIQSEGEAQILLTGKLAIDDNAASVGPMIAEFLNWPHVSVVSKSSLENRILSVERDIEGGAKEVLQISLPVSLSANKGLNSPRYASLPGIMKAKKKTIKEVDFKSLNIQSSAHTVIERFHAPADKAPVKILSGELSSQCQQLIQLLRDEAKVL
ncbi:MAG: electron transfer flavoprotein subunit beta/FixA family protein [Pseudobdellovibrionaceae bacterium]